MKNLLTFSSKLVVVILITSSFLILNTSLSAQSGQKDIEEELMFTEPDGMLDTLVLYDPETYTETIYIVKNSQQDSRFRNLIMSYENGVRVNFDPQGEKVSRVLLISESGVIDIAKPANGTDDAIDIEVPDGEYKVYVQQGDQVVHTVVVVK